ncbi:F-box/kelch-repeat protein At3g06240-like [Papaver somniferum]|uniref:F-box/kelch-repeat protein At3g06240-like n=1 Tax=Papaver somniferum TaxID=3469 RepID=UPI000E701294|nr:F-box/kelch-repeat protein At3g06240-like [Papaver somniferum]
MRTQSRTLNSTSYDSIWSVDGSESEKVKLADYKFSSHWILRFLGSCNGLVCIWGRSTEHEISICFCNPATKEYKRIVSESVPSYDSIHINAFGYDCKAGDYKLIFLDEHVEFTELLVYTLGSNTWKSSQSVPYTFNKERQTGVLVNGAFHWLGQARNKNSSKLIVVFDFCTEKFDELQLPEELLEKRHLPMTVGVLEGRLCVVVTVSEVSFQVWVMQDYAVQESWAPLYTFDHSEDYMSDYDADYDALKLMPSFRNGHILVKMALEPLHKIHGVPND